MTDTLGVDRVLASLEALRARGTINAVSVAMGRSLARARLAGRLLTRWVARGLEDDLPQPDDGPIGLARWALERVQASDDHAAAIEDGEGEALTIEHPAGPMVPEAMPLAEKLALAGAHALGIVEHELACVVTAGSREAAQVENGRVSSDHFAARVRANHSPPITVPGWRVGFEYRTRRDDRVRRGRPQDHGENHKAVDRIRAPHDDPVWDFFSPPMGHNCRCILSPTRPPPKWTADALAIAISRGASPAPGFGRRG